MNRLNGKVAILSGAASGMGAAEVWLFAREGAHVVAGDINDAQLKTLAAHVNAEIGREVVIAVHLDVTEAASWNALVDQATKHWGGVDILVNNAGILNTADILATSDEDWDDIVGVNQKGTWLGIKHVVPAMKERGGGAIVNISSVGGLVGLPYSGAYAATKGAVRMISKHAAIAFAGDNIRCNTIYPGAIHTPMLDFLAPTAADLEAAAAVSPLKRLGLPSEIASAALFLASDEAAFITGADLAVDGGYTAQ
ncbi:glucose 1-dehydrogenase [soil metagenome]